MNLPDYTNCTLCPRMCHVNRSVTTGYLADRKKNQAAAALSFSPAVPYAAVSARIQY